VQAAEAEAQTPSPGSVHFGGSWRQRKQRRTLHHLAVCNFLQGGGSGSRGTNSITCRYAFWGKVEAAEAEAQTPSPGGVHFLRRWRQQKQRHRLHHLPVCILGQGGGSGSRGTNSITGSVHFEARCRQRKQRHKLHHMPVCILGQGGGSGSRGTNFITWQCAFFCKVQAAKAEAQTPSLAVCMFGCQTYT